LFLLSLRFWTCTLRFLDGTAGAELATCVRPLGSVSKVAVALTGSPW
jgi:hypothetical protein